MTEPTDPETMFEAVRAQLTAARDTDPRTPIALHLGTAQRAAIEAYVAKVSGRADAGPLVSFQGLVVRPSKKADHMAVLYAEGDDPDPPDDAADAPIAPAPAVTPDVPVQAADAVVEATPSAG